MPKAKRIGLPLQSLAGKDFRESCCLLFLNSCLASWCKVLWQAFTHTQKIRSSTVWPRVDSEQYINRKCRIMLYLKETSSSDHHSYSHITAIWFSEHFLTNFLHNSEFWNTMRSLQWSVMSSSLLLRHSGSIISSYVRTDYKHLWIMLETVLESSRIPKGFHQ